MKYLYGVKFTTEFLNEDGSVAETTTEIKERHSEGEARAVIQETLRRLGKAHPRSHRVVDARLVRRPVGAWEEVK
jgi:hypothetical protein